MRLTARHSSGIKQTMLQILALIIFVCVATDVSRRVHLNRAIFAQFGSDHVNCLAGLAVSTAVSLAVVREIVFRTRSFSRPAWRPFLYSSADVSEGVSQVL